LTEPKNASGLSLIEVCVSIAVFAILILGIGQTVLVGQKAANETRRQANILLGCQQVLERVQQRTVPQLIAENGSTFRIRAAGPEGPLEDGGLITVDKDLNGDGTVQAGSLYREGRTEDDLVRVLISFQGRAIIEKVVARRQN
jgi:type II secretory pathway pseudopilin PulG